MSSKLQMLENERSYVARELHDGVAQTTQQLMLQAALCRKLLERRRLETLAEELAVLEGRAQHASQQVRELIVDMNPPRAEPDAPFVEWVRAEIDAHLERGGPPTEFELQTQEPIPDLPGDTRIALVRILQEALLNARKHAKARQINVILSLEDTTLRLAVVDDGQGFSPGELRARLPERGGSGLQAMRARAQALGGGFRVQTAPDQGTRVEASLPVG
ncbi:MAG: sensor histidine kinase [Anaerolineales bacterium]|nr:MAG: sensor histidine kinase [Anaerolineales bacterium]